MYTTKPLSLYKNTPDAISWPTQGPNSGYLVIQDEESTPTCCFGLCYDTAIVDLPFPQNKLISIEYHVNNGEGGGYHSSDRVYVIPVVNHPLSSNRYYVVKADGKRKGEAYASSKDEDKVTCFFCIRCTKDVKPRPLDPEDIYQQFEFSVSETCCNCKDLKAKSIAPDGHPPSFLRRSGWTMNAKKSKTFTLGEARGLDSTLRAHLPDLGFPLSQQHSSPVVVGKWYCPFMFIKEETEKEQFKKSVYYEMTLEQKWEKIFSMENDYGHKGNVMAIDVVVQREKVVMVGKEAMLVEGNDGKGVVWYRTIDGKGEDAQVGLSTLIVERMMWEQERGGWIKGNDKHVRVVKDEDYGGVAGWKSFGCYMLVETFVLKRNDGSLVLTYDFNHTHQLRSKWE